VPTVRFAQLRFFTDVIVLYTRIFHVSSLSLVVFV
jgi:hypothetical protein